MLIGITGRAGHGKSSAALWLATHHQFQERAFASVLKDALIRGLLRNPPMWATWGMLFPDQHMVQTSELPAAWRDAFYTDKTPFSRWLMQFIGTDILRHFQPDWAVRQMDYTGDRVVISDVRFPDEAEVIRSRGGVLIRVVRKGYNESSGAGHVSETNTESLEADFVLEAATGVESLHAALEAAYPEIEELCAQRNESVAMRPEGKGAEPEGKSLRRMPSEHERKLRDRTPPEAKAPPKPAVKEPT